MSTHPVEKQRAETRAPQAAEKRTGLTFRRHFTTAGRHPFDEVTWERRSAVINDEKGQPVFEQHDIEVPDDLEPDGDEHRRLEVLPRPARRARARGERARPDRARGRHDPRAGPTRRATSRRLRRPARPSPTSSRTCSSSRRWPSTARSGSTSGSRSAPQCSACFINSVNDTMDSILGLAKHRGHAVQVRLRHRLEPVARSAPRRSRLAGGGTASGPVSFMRGYDAFAGVIKSGGKTRRAAKMVILNIGPPGRRRVHPQQGRRGEEGLGADRRRLRRLLQRARRRLRLGVLPERQPLGARDRRLHARGGRGPRLDDALRAHGRALRDLQRARPDDADGARRPGSAAIPASSTTPRSTTGTPARTRRASTAATRAASTCSSTTRPATWRAST